MKTPVFRLIASLKRQMVACIQALSDFLPFKAALILIIDPMFYIYQFDRHFMFFHLAISEVFVIILHYIYPKTEWKPRYVGFVPFIEISGKTYYITCINCFRGPITCLSWIGFLGKMITNYY